MSDHLTVGIEWEPQFTFLNYPNHRVYFKTTKRRKFLVYTQHETSDINRVTLDVPPSFNTWRSTRVATNNMNKNNRYRYTSIDQTNFEVITKPVTVEKLPLEIIKADRYLKEFCLNISKVVGRIGVFLPNWGYGTPSKHINISDKLPIKFIPDSDVDFYKEVRGLHTKGFHSKIEFKGECRNHKERVHLTVPYNFTDYNRLLEFFYKSDVNKSDILFYLYRWSLKHPMPLIKGTKKRSIFLGFTDKNRYVRVNNLL